MIYIMMLCPRCEVFVVKDPSKLVNGSDPKIRRLGASSVTMVDQMQWLIDAIVEGLPLRQREMVMLNNATPPLNRGTAYASFLGP